MFMGIDCSSKTIHITVLDEKGDVEYMEKWESKEKDMDERMISLFAQFDNWLNQKQQAFHPFAHYTAVVENPIYVQNIKATVGIAQVIAAVKIALSRYHMVTFGIDNRTWKKSVVGDGRSDKAKIMKFAQAKWGDVFKEQDWADAACLAFWGAQRLGRMTNE